jgi:anaerobic magnesium-protoporphyrin IX monomethyl ester cyclase
MTDILLIQPPIRDFYLTAKRTIPYGLAAIAAILSREGFTVEILDALATPKSRLIDLPEEFGYLRDHYGRSDLSPFRLFHGFRHYGYSFQYIADRSRASGAFLIGISALFTPYVDATIQTAEHVKASHPACKIVIGGHHPTALPESVLESRAIDFVLRGEGEVGMPFLAKALKGRYPLQQVPGIAYRRPDGTIQVNEPALMEDLDAYPLPSFHLLRHSYYQRGTRNSTVIAASRGCPMRCTYCSVGVASGFRYRRRRVSSVLGEIEAAVEAYNIGFIDFEDENLSLEREWFLELLLEIRTRLGGNGLELRAMNGLFPPSLDDEVVAAMKQAGFRTLNLSLGSTCEEQLNRFQRPDIREAFDRALSLAEEYELNTVGYVIAGAPFQRPEDSVIDLLYLAARRVLASVSIFYPSPGSADYDLCGRLQILPPSYSLMRATALPISHTTTRLQAATILRLGRILNFMKMLVDRGCGIPSPALCREKTFVDLKDRTEIGRRLLQGFLHDGKIRGVGPEGRLFEYPISVDLTEQFIKGLEKIQLKGCVIGER